MNKITLNIRQNLRQYAMLIALVVIALFFQIGTKGILLQPRNVSKLIYQNSYILIMAIGMLMCILTGGNIDLSVGSILAAVSAVSGLMATKLGYPVWISMIVGLLLGFAAGAWQGFWFAYIKIPSFIVTLAGMLIFRGINNMILNGETIGLPQPYITIAAGVIPDFIGGPDAPLNMVALVFGWAASIIYVVNVFLSRISKGNKGYEVTPLPWALAKTVLLLAVINVFALWLAKDDGVPIILVILIVLVWIYNFITKRTIPGRHLYAVGGNAKAAELSGIKIKQIYFWVYANMGLLCAVAGIVFAGRLNAASPTAGEGFEMEAIAACYIGGASARGGIGTVLGAVIGGLTMGILNNGMSIMGLETFWQQIAKGLVLLAAVAFDVMSKSKTASKSV